MNTLEKWKKLKEIDPNISIQIDVSGEGYYIQSKLTNPSTPLFNIVSYPGKIYHDNPDSAVHAFYDGLIHAMVDYGYFILESNTGLLTDSTYYTFTDGNLNAIALEEARSLYDKRMKLNHA